MAISVSEPVGRTFESEVPQTKSEESLVFDPHTLRLIVGVIALSFSLVVSLLATTITSSISASYHTNARDVFVGFLFIIGALLVAYKGHAHQFRQDGANTLWNRIRAIWGQHEEDLLSTLGGAAALAAAIFPTMCDDCTRDLRSDIHSVAAIILFLIVMYFCLIPFPYRAFSKSGEAKDAKFNFFDVLRYAGQKDRDDADKKKKLRIRIYLFCGLGIGLVMLGLVVAQFAMVEETRLAYRLTFVAETVALLLFGISWITASQPDFLVDENEKHPPRTK